MLHLFRYFRDNPQVLQFIALYVLSPMLTLFLHFICTQIGVFIWEFIIEKKPFEELAQDINVEEYMKSQIYFLTGIIGLDILVGILAIFILTI